MTWHLEPSALGALRAQLLERGKLIEPRADATRSSEALGNSPEVEALLRRVAPFLELLYLMMVTDGKCHEHERQLLRGVTRTLGGADLPPATVRRLLATFDDNLAAEGTEGRLETVANSLIADRLDAETAFTLTATMALADCDVDVPELGLLSHLAEVLGISTKRAHELIVQRPHATTTPPTH